MSVSDPQAASATAQPFPSTSSLPPLPPRSRPLGVSLLSLLVGLYGLLWVILGVLVLAGVSIGAWEKYAGAVTKFGSLTSPLEVGAIVLVVGLIIMGIAVALWRLRLWALVLALLVLIFVMVSYGLGGTAGISAHIYGFVIAVLLFVYLLAVSRHFRG